MTEDQLRQILDEGIPEWEIRTAKQNCSSDEVIPLLETQAYFNLMQLPEPDNRTAILERFTRESLLVEDGSEYSITNLGAILFAENLDAFEGLPRAENL